MLFYQKYKRDEYHLFKNTMKMGFFILKL